MIQELENNAVFSNEYRPRAPKKGDLAAVYENRGRDLLMSLDQDGALRLPEAILFQDYWIEPDDEEAEEKMALKGGRLIYLFSIDDTAFYGFIYYDKRTADFSFTGMEFQPFSFGNKARPKNVYFGAETAFQLNTWYNDNRRCGRCGEPMLAHPKIRACRCRSCGYMVFPRVLPAVIISVVHDDKLLMIRYRGREEDGYAGTALIAGFCEVGETVEDTVRREVMEEAGLKAANIRYYKSQPWGFASNLLIGVICDIEGSDEIAVQDTNEVAEAVWLTRDEIGDHHRIVSLTDEMISYFKFGDDFPNHLTE